MKKHITPIALLAAVTIGLSDAAAQSFYRLDFANKTGQAPIGTAVAPFGEVNFPNNYLAPGGATTFARRVGTGNVEVIASGPNYQTGVGSSSQLLFKSSNSTNKFTTYDFSAPTKVAYTAFTFKSIAAASAEGNQEFYVGNGAAYLNNANARPGGPAVASAISLDHQIGTDINLRVYNTNDFGSTPVAVLKKGQVYKIEMYTNNASNLTPAPTYTRCGGSSVTLPARTMHLYINGQQVGGNLPVGGLNANTNIDDFGIWGFQSSVVPAPPTTFYESTVVYDDFEFSSSLTPGPLNAINYTVDPNGSGSNNFYSLVDALDAITCRGITAPININANAGIYRGALTFGEYNFPITITGAPGAVIEHCPTSAGANVNFITLNGTDNVTISGFTMNSPCAYGAGFRLQGGTNNITISGNTINMPDAGPNSTSVVNRGIYATGAGQLTITGNVIDGGRRGIQIEDQAGVATVSGNTITDAYEYGIGMLAVNNPIVSDNTVQMRTGYTESRAFDGNSVQGLTLTDNLFFNAGRAGVLLQNSNDGTSRLINNRIGGFQTADKSYGMFLYNVDDVEIYHNSIRIDNAPSSGNALRTGNASELDVRNNIFASTTNTGSTVPVYGSPSSFEALAQNSYFNAAGGAILFLNQLVPDLAALQTLGFDVTGSSQVDPMLMSDLRLDENSPVRNVAAAQVLAGAGEDFEGDDRVANSVDLGADEYVAGQPGPVRLAVTLSADVYPNPFTSSLTIQVQDLNAGAVQVVVTDLMGRQILSQNQGMEKGASAITLNLDENLAQGVYLLQVTQGDATATFRVVKQ